ncbi:hypothetical protein ACVIU7_007978 [Bradyrhizobium liaoningense]
MSDQARSTVGQRQIGRAGQKRANLDLDRPGKQVPRAGTNDIGQWIDSGTTTPPRLGGRDERDSRVDLTTRGTLVPCIKTDIKTGMMPPPISGSR